jgi:hypothetical protein
VEPEDRDVWAYLIRLTTLEADQSKATVDNTVIDARKAGASWATIARGLGITRQGAMRRYVVIVEEEQAREEAML